MGGNDSDDELEHEREDQLEREVKPSGQQRALRTAVTSSINVVRFLLHGPAAHVLARAADALPRSGPAPMRSLRERLVAAAEQGLDVAALAERFVSASTRALRDTGLSNPSFEMTGEALAVMVRLAAQVSTPTLGLSTDELYDGAVTYYELQKYSMRLEQRRKLEAGDGGRKFGPGAARPPVEALNRAARHAMAVYGSVGMRALDVLNSTATDLEALEYLTGSREEHTVLAAKWRANWVGSIYSPGYYCMADHAEKEILLVTRGSFRIQDVVTDLMCEDAEFKLFYQPDGEDREDGDGDGDGDGEGDDDGDGEGGDDRATARARARDKDGELETVFSTLSDALGDLRDRVNTLGDLAEEETVRSQLHSWVSRQSRVLEEDDGGDEHAATQYFGKVLSRGALDPHGEAPGHEHMLGRTHFGMMKAAQSLRKEVEDVLVDAVRANPGYKLKLIGHSLGAAVSALLTMLWAHHPDLKKAHCYAIACPGTFGLDMATSPLVQSKITSVVLGDDVVPRLSLGAVSDLRDSAVFCATKKVKTGETVAAYVAAKLKAAKRLSSQDKRDKMLHKAFAPIMKEISQKIHVHDKLYPPGVVWHIRDQTQTINEAKKAKNEDFGTVTLSSGMFNAHLPQRYAFGCCAKFPLSKKAADEETRRESVASAGASASIKKRFSLRSK